jgi:UDP-glucose-4-epimerase GalE
VRILVTGGAGYIGSITARYLLERGHEVVVLDSLVHGRAEAVPDGAELVVADVGDVAAHESALAGCDAIVHCAGYIEVAQSVAEPALYQANNVTAPTALMASAVHRGVRNVVFSSTAAVYGEPAEVPIPEDAPTAPVNPYGATKLAFERLLAQLDASAGLRSVSLRYFNAAGAWPDGSMGEAHDPETHLIPRVLTALAAGEPVQVYGDDWPTADGSCERDFVHVMDLAAAHLLAVDYLLGDGRTCVLNLGSGRGHTVFEVVAACERAAGRKAAVQVLPRREGDPARLLAAPGLAADVLGWRERSDLDTMVSDAQRWHAGRGSGR